MNAAVIWVWSLDKKKHDLPTLFAPDKLYAVP